MPLQKMIVLGNPVAHSQSPILYRKLFQEYNIPAAYARLWLHSLEHLPQILEHLEIIAFNVTAPFKEEILDKLPVNAHASVQKTQATNCLVRTTKGWDAYNFDIDGVENSIKHIYQKNNFPKLALLVGAGGAAKAAACALQNLNIPFFVCNRTFEKAKKLAKEFNAEALSLTQLSKLSNIELIISTLPASVPLNELHSIFLTIKQGGVIFDANYHASSLATWVQTQKNSSVRYVSGIIWLCYQALPAMQKIFQHALPVDTMLSIIQESTYSSHAYQEPQYWKPKTLQELSDLQKFAQSELIEPQIS